MADDDLAALARDLIAARELVARNEANHLAVRALCALIRPLVGPNCDCWDDHAPLFEAFDRGELLPGWAAESLLLESADWLEFFEAQPSHETPELDARIHRSRIRVVSG